MTEEDQAALQCGHGLYLICGFHINLAGARHRIKTLYWGPLPMGTPCAFRSLDRRLLIILRSLNKMRS